MNPREMDVLSILFKEGVPMTASEITDKRLELTQSTVTAVLRKLLNAQYVEVVGTTHSGKVLSRTYVGTQKAREAMVEYLLSIYDNIKGIVPAEEICEKIKKKANEGKTKEKKGK